MKVDDLVNGQYEIAKCGKYWYIWQTEVLNAQSQDKLYSKWISSSHSLNKKTQAEFSLYSRYSEEMKKIHSFFLEKPFGFKLLDFGMGWGFWCLMAQAFGYDVEGYELSPERISYACQRGVRVVDDNRELMKRKYDFINVEQVFEHLSHPLAKLKELVSMLTPRGIMHIFVPDGSKIETELLKPMWQAGKNAIHPLEHINCYTNKTLIYFAALAGLKKIDSGSEKSDSSVRFIKNFLHRRKKVGETTNLYFKKN